MLTHSHNAILFGIWGTGMRVGWGGPVWADTAAQPLFASALPVLGDGHSMTEIPTPQGRPSCLRSRRPLVSVFLFGISTILWVARSLRVDPMRGFKPP